MSLPRATTRTPSSLRRSRSSMGADGAAGRAFSGPSWRSSRTPRLVHDSSARAQLGECDGAHDQGEYLIDTD